MPQHLQSTNSYGWSKLPAIPSYPGDEETAESWRKKFHQVTWPLLVSAAIIPLNFYIYPRSPWWPWFGTVLFAVLFLRAILIDVIWKDKLLPAVVLLCSILGWWVLPLFLPDLFSRLWRDACWPLTWPLLLGLLAVWVNVRSGLLPWWWHWIQPILLVGSLVLIAFLAGSFR